MRTGKVRPELRAAKPIDRFAIEIVGRGAVAQECAAAGLDAERELVRGGLCRLRKLVECVACQLRVPFACGRLDEFRQCVRRHRRIQGVHGGLQRRHPGILIAGDAVVHDRSRPMRRGC
jgi:hypothetical protein